MKTITLTKGYHALVDAEDFERLSKFKWCASIESRGTKVYAKRKTRKDEKARWRSPHVRLHHAVLNVAPNELPAGHVVDHVNHDGLDCRKFIDGKIQLEIVHQSVNMTRSLGWKRKKEEPCL